MKNLSFILGILILALALKPCADVFCVDTDVCVEDSCESHHEDEQQDDSCAMLCVCNCCGALVLHQELPVFTIHSKLKIATKINSQYKSHYRFDITSAIWQPPKYVS